MGRVSLRGLVVAVIIVALLVLIATQSNPQGTAEVEPYSYLERQLEAGAVERIVVSGSRLTVTPTEGEQFTTYLASPPEDLSRFTSDGAQVEATAPQNEWSRLLVYLLPVALMIGFLLYLMRGNKGGGDGSMTFGKSRARLEIGRASCRERGRGCVGGGIGTRTVCTETPHYSGLACEVRKPRSR